MIIDLNEKKWVWYYDYNAGKQRVLFLECVNNKCKIKYNDDTFDDVVATNLFLTETECDLYAYAFNYKRGWLKREIERNPTEELSRRLKESIRMFPELYI